MTSVLCVEDDEFFAHEITHALNDSGINVRHVMTAAEALRCLDTEKFDLITLDRMLPDEDGIELLKRVRRVHHDMPVIMISGMNSVEDRLMGITAGCRDYIVKPFSSEEVVARILVHLRYQNESNNPTAIIADGVKINLIEKSLSYANNTLFLKNVEFKLMSLLIKNHGILITRSMILEAVWGYNFDPGTKVIDVHINALRKKLDSLSSPLQINNLRGSGFILMKNPKDE